MISWGPLANQKIPRPEHQRRCLLFLALHGDEPHVRALRRLADRLRIDGIVLVPLHERLDVSRRDQPDRMAHVHQLATPVMGTAASFQSDGAGRLAAKKSNTFPQLSLLLKSA